MLRFCWLRAPPSIPYPVTRRSWSRDVDFHSVGALACVQVLEVCYARPGEIFFQQKTAKLALRVISFSRLYYEILRLHGDVNFVVAGGDVGFIRNVAQTVLIAEFFIQVGINLFDGHLFGNFKKAPASFPGYLLENFLPVGTRFLRISPMSTSSHSATATAPSAIPSAVSVSLFVGKKNGVNESIRALGRFDGVLQTFLAAVVHSVGKNNKGLASLLLFHQFVRRKVHGVV